MNFSLPHSWLKEYLKTSASPQQISRALSLCGPSVEKLTQKGDDWIYDIEVTTNRVDCMSVIGIAREAAAILPQFGFPARLKTNPLQPAETSPSAKSFPLKLSVDKQLCPRFSAAVINNVTIKASPKKIRHWLEKSGLRPINNLVDIANFLMRTYGQPVHTFDLDKIKDKMVLRLSQKGESITTLDKKTFKLTGNDIVIEDGGNRLIDLCGIMGGLNSAVDEQTKNVLLFVQIYNPRNIRHTSMSLGQRTEAAQLFEKDLDPELVMPVLMRGIQLFKEWSGGELGSNIVDIYPKPVKSKTVAASLQLIKDRLGVEISQKEIDQILKSLGFVNNLVPSWRNKDINLAEDIIEEVARIYGYHRLPSTLMATTIPLNYPEENFNLEQQLKFWLAGLGATELYTNSLISATLALQSGFPLSLHLKIKNALSEDWQYLRRSLIPSHLSAFKDNPKTEKIVFFEVANTYHPRKGQLPDEQPELIISTKQAYSKLKGMVEALFQQLHLTVKFEAQPGRAEIIFQQKALGAIGPAKTDPQVQVAVIQLKPVLAHGRIYPCYQPISGFPPIIEDLTFTLKPKTYLGPVIEAISRCHPLIKTVSLHKTFQHNFTFRLSYQSPQRALTDKVVLPVRKKIIQLLNKRFAAKLVGKI